ncbi:MAG: helix-turn-helix transcriptional regulator [Chitinophagaceae bacterium]|nr:helix-turn-helix transcriptional regulator [Chitinophagaceae bacterium]
MEQKALYQPFELYVSDMEHWNERPLIHHFFEIVQILEGNGKRVVNENDLLYSKGSIFLFTPLDCRGFCSETPTRFCSIRFSEVFLGQYKHVRERERISQWLKQLEHIFFHHNRYRELLIRRPGDCHMIAALISNMIEEYEHRQPYHEENLQHFVTLILNILARNVSEGAVTTETGPDQEPYRMLLHIHQHIGRPEKLRVEYLASHFNLSANYVGEYFRKLTGESLQHYIMQYKIKLAQHRLAYSMMTISQIADELGFTDESHLGRQFRKYVRMGPGEYRRRKKAV